MKILYLLHTDWNWIKQRSQFLAEHLDRLDCDITVAYKFSLKRKGLVSNESNVRKYGYLFLPFSLRKIKILRIFDSFFWRFYFSIACSIFKYERIIVTHPLLGRYVKDCGVPIIYDCHDDNAEFYPPGKLRNMISCSHFELLKVSSKTIFSSCHLAEKYSLNSSDIVIRNGHNNLRHRPLNRMESNLTLVKETYDIFYFGTVSEWFDQGLILQSLKEIENLRITVIGPSDITLEQHDRLVVVGPMDHEALMNKCVLADAFIMPFVMNELIMGVDPVKLYEYLSFNVPVISCYYKELNHFGSLIQFYKSRSDLNHLIRHLISQRYCYDPDSEGRVRFLKDSSWQARALEFKCAISL